MTGDRLDLPIAADHPAFAGHFPGQPILPGVVLLDLALHAIAAHRNLADEEVRMRAAKFLSPVRPGEALQLHFEIRSSGAFDCEIRAADRVVANCQLDFPANRGDG